MTKNPVEIRIFQAYARLKAIYKGPFVRKDGMVLPFWDDCSKLWSDPKLFRFYIEEIAKIIKKSPYKFVVGAAVTGIPLAAAVAFKTNKSFSFVRKERKGYSAKQLIDGYLPKGSKVILIDDALVAGEAKDVFVRQVKKVGSQVKEIVTFMDIGLKEGKEWLAKRRVKFHALYTYPHLFQYLLDKKLITSEFYFILSQFIKDPHGWHKDKKIWQKFLRLRGNQPLWRAE